MWEIAKWSQSIKRHGGILGAVRKMLALDDIKVGTLVGNDKYGNQYFENKQEVVLGRDRWVELNNKWSPQEPTFIPPEWHAWIHRMTDEPPGSKNSSTFFARLPGHVALKHKANLTGTPGAYRPYDTTAPKLPEGATPLNLGFFLYSTRITMVKINEIKPKSKSKDKLSNSNSRTTVDHFSDDDDGKVYSDADEFIDADEESLEEETVWQRLYALTDIFPAHKREQFVESLQNHGRSAWKAARFAGNVAWILTTSAMVLAVPLMFEIEREQSMLQWEKEQQNMQKQGAQQMLTPSLPSNK